MNSDRRDKTYETDSSAYHRPHTVDDVTDQNVKTIMHLEDAARANRDFTDHMADIIAGFCGSFIFVWVHIIWFGIWVVINALPGVSHFDPFPFTFLTLVVSLEAIFLSSFILISENLETRVSERRITLICRSIC